MGRLIFDPRPSTEKRREVFDFLSDLAVGETISSASVAVTVFSGSDNNPNNTKSGSVSIDGSKVYQFFDNGTNGVLYLPTCTANTSLGQELQLSAYMAVIGPSL